MKTDFTDNSVQKKSNF